VAVAGGTVAEALDSLTGLYPALKPHLFNGAGELRPFVNLFLNEDNIRDLQGVETHLQAEDQVLIIPSIAGG
jgi:adenylyltransferase/sulfurtransferase